MTEYSVGEVTLKFPKAWDVCRVAEAGIAILGLQKTAEADRGLDLRSYLRVANVHDDEINLDDVATMVFTADTRDRYRLQPGDVLLCEGQSRELVGRAAIYTGNPEEVYFQNTLIRFRAHPEVIPEYALTLFRAYQHSGIFSQVAKGTTNIFHLGLKRFEDLPFPVPPRPVQAAIAAAVRQGQDAIDTLRNALTNSLATVDEFARGVRDLYLLNGPKSSEGEWPTAEDGAVSWRAASEVVDSPIVYGILQPGPDVTDGSGVPYIRGQDLQEGEILAANLRATSAEINEKYHRSILSTGDVLLGIIRQTRVAIVPSQLEGANVTQGTAVLHPGPEIESAYLAHWLASGAAQEWLRRHMRGIDMPGLNLRDVRRLPVPVVGIDDQRRIATQLDLIIDNAAAMKRWLEASYQKAAELEDELLADLAYGPIASRMSTLALGDLQSSAAAALGSRLRDRASAEPKGRPAGPKESSGRGRRVKSSSPMTANRLVATLGRLGESVSPEDLFKGLELGYEDVDSFYSSLRDLNNRGLIRIRRPDDASVFIEIAD